MRWNMNSQIKLSKCDRNITIGWWMKKKIKLFLKKWTIDLVTIAIIANLIVTTPYSTCKIIIIVHYINYIRLTGAIMAVACYAITRSTFASIAANWIKTLVLAATVLCIAFVNIYSYLLLLIECQEWEVKEIMRRNSD